MCACMFVYNMFVLDNVCNCMYISVGYKNKFPSGLIKYIIICLSSRHFQILSRLKLFSNSMIDHEHITINITISPSMACTAYLTTLSLEIDTVSHIWSSVCFEHYIINIKC